ncbi:SCO2400 family protein [Kitasatospora aburaviensis]|uniref:SCO2400 family protein n=1 Tax=Kitasatospora aburaviensis TaxID=67265 RepID=UPI003A94A7CE
MAVPPFGPGPPPGPGSLPRVPGRRRTEPQGPEPRPARDRSTALSSSWRPTVVCVATVGRSVDRTSGPRHPPRAAAGGAHPGANGRGRGRAVPAPGDPRGTRHLSRSLTARCGIPTGVLPRLRMRTTACAAPAAKDDDRRGRRGPGTPAAREDHMDYCAPCRRHLNGALACPGCGALATGPDQAVPPAPAAPGPGPASRPAPAEPRPVPAASERSGGRTAARRGARRSGRRRGRLVVSVVGLAVVGLGAAALAANGSETTPSEPGAGRPATAEPQSGPASGPATPTGVPSPSATSVAPATQRPSPRPTTASRSASTSASASAAASSKGGAPAGPETTPAPDPGAQGSVPPSRPAPSTVPATTPPPPTTPAPKPTPTCTQFLFWCS